ncbi:MAG: TlpA disulfide reductase family protein [Polyangiaceae bacterium]
MTRSHGAAALLFFGAFAQGCDPSETVARESATTASGSSSAPVPGASSVKPKRPFCAAAPAADGKKPASVTMARLFGDGTPDTSLTESLETGGGKWTWINLWAGWCQPCREEMPILKAWEGQLSDKLRVRFVSLDDDARLASRFLNQQPATGVRQSYHLEDDKAKSDFLDSIGLAKLDKLPMHVILDPAGAVRCVIKGSIDAADLPSLQAMIARGQR